jgi:GT2 family glycosyltransferase
VGFITCCSLWRIIFSQIPFKKIGFPREDFFVYVDDYEWTYRITRQGGKIVVFPDLQIEDIIKSWHTKEEKASFFYKILNTNDEKRVYYTIRNRIVFERENFVDNEIVYKINMFLFLTFLKLYKNRNNKKQYETILKAIRDGLDKKLGRFP